MSFSHVDETPSYTMGPRWWILQGGLGLFDVAHHPSWILILIIQHSSLYLPPVNEDFDNHAINVLENKYISTLCTLSQAGQVPCRLNCI